MEAGTKRGPRKASAKQAPEHRPSDVFASRLRETRLARGLSQTELANRMTEAGRPLSKAALLRIETGQRGLSLDEALALAQLLQIAPAHLLSPPDGARVMLTEKAGVDGAGMRNWLLFGDPLLLTPEGRRSKSRTRMALTVEAFALAITDAKRGGDRAGADAARAALEAAVLANRDEVWKIDHEGRGNRGA